MKFLIIRFSSIGDIVLTTPVIRCLKQQTPGAEVHVLVKESFRSIVIGNTYIDKVQVLAHSWELMMHELLLEDYDYVIDLHNNLRTWRIRKALKKPFYSFKKLNLQKYIYTNLKWNLMPEKHIVDRYMDTVSKFNITNDGAGLDYFIPREYEVNLNDIPASHHAGYIAIVIGAAHNTKKYPVHKLQSLCEKLDHPVILLGGKEDKENGEIISLPDPVKIYNACGKFSLNESADLVRKSKLVVTNDTGLMHIAAAFKKPVISLWGNTVPSFGMYPYYGVNYLQYKTGSPYDILQVNKLWCRPCSKIGYNKCPRGHFKCMENIGTTEVLQLINKRLT
ncbi:MAG: glycosyltransferase family 9 protein [Chitinophagaceae bacterium]|jgi:heptosyltransferase-2|nr:glycosyltransferase family 9 protein [Chitinophagaceae bacterium]